MKTKKINRYWCDFCKKTGGSAGHMRKHEDRCTNNPSRKCGICEKMIQQEQPSLTDLIAILPDSKEFEQEQSGIFLDEPIIVLDETALKEAIDKIMPKLRDMAGDCPACILASIRQSNIPTPIVTSFDFQKELKALWGEINEADSGQYDYL